MGQQQSSGATQSHTSLEDFQQSVKDQQPHNRTCRPCVDFGKKDYNTVKVDPAALRKACSGKENQPNGNAFALMMRNEVERQNGIQEWRAEQERIQREEAIQQEMRQRVREEQERQWAEQRRRELERQSIVLEQQRRDREAKERHEEEMRQAQLEQERLEKQQEQIRLQEEEKQRKIKEIEDEKKLHTFLQSQGFKNPNDLVRKRWTKVTPLHTAVEQTFIEMVRILLTAGADPKKVSGKNETALRLAQKLDKNGTHTEIIQQLTPVTLC